MTKLSIQRVFETSKLLATDSGKELQELIGYVAEFAEQTLRILRNGVGVADQLDAQLVNAIVVSGEETEISTNKVPIGIFPIRIQEEGTKNGEFGWYLNDQGRVITNLVVTGTALDQYTVTYLVIYS